jgi:uncharacterized protein YkwD
MKATHTKSVDVSNKNSINLLKVGTNMKKYFLYCILASLVILLFSPKTYAVRQNWLDSVNYYRAIADLPPVKENTTYSAGCKKHAIYMAKNNIVANHKEDPNKQFYSTEGALAAPNSNELLSGKQLWDEEIIKGWMEAPYHALGILNPKLKEVGFGSYSWLGATAGCLDVQRGIGSLPSSVTYPVKFPGKNAYMPVLDYPGNEKPDPLVNCNSYKAPTGPPIMFQLNNTLNLTSTLFKEYDETTKNWINLEHCKFKYGNAVVIMPRNRLKEGKDYEVHIAFNGTSNKWLFTTRPAKLWGNILWSHTSGLSGVWFMNGETYRSVGWTAYIPDTKWQLVATGDFSYNGQTDFLWRNSSTGENLVSYSDGAKSTTYNNVLEKVSDTNWEVKGTGDFDGDGRIDILWRHSVYKNRILIWLMDGVNHVKNLHDVAGHYVWSTANPDLKIVATGDFNGDFICDIVWGHEKTGQNFVIYTSIDYYEANDRYDWLPSVRPNDWKIVGAGDINNDGKTDIMLRHPKGGNAVWYMDGTTKTSEGFLPPLDVNWKMVGTGNFE